MIPSKYTNENCFIKKLIFRINLQLIHKTEYVKIVVALSFFSRKFILLPNNY